MSIVDFINIPSHLLRADAEERAAQVAAEYLGELRDRLATPEQVAEWAAAGGRWWEKPPTPEEEEGIRWHRALMRQHGEEPERFHSWRVTLAMEGDPRGEVWNRAHKVLDVLGPLGPGEDVRDAALAWAASADDEQAEDLAFKVQQELNVLRKRMAAAAVLVERVDLEKVSKEAGVGEDGEEDFAQWPLEVRAEGVLRRLSAGLGSIATRRDGQSYLSWSEVTQKEDAWGFGPTYQTKQRIRWWSPCGVWSKRGWQVSATVVVKVDHHHGDTDLSMEDVEVTVLGAGGVTAFTGRPLWTPVAELFRARLAREKIREISCQEEPLISDVERVYKDASPEEFVAFALLDPWGEYE